jgi:hypothetical protein
MTDLSKQIVLTPRQLSEWRNAHPSLVEVIEDILTFWPWPKQFVVTCIARTVAEDGALGGSGVHASGPSWRALDFRISHLGVDYQEQADRMAEAINSKWIYDLARPELSVLVTARHGTGPHGHVQVHPSTRRRNV